MTILGIDTSAVSCGAAVLCDGKILSDIYVNVGLTHSQTLMRIVDSALGNCALTLSDVDAVAVAAGPGSFTGIRIGISAVKGMCFERDIPVYGISTLEALAVSVQRTDCIVCPVMDARCAQVYTAAFSFGDDGKLVRLWDDMPLSLAELEKKLAVYDKPVVFTGDGCTVAEKYFSDKNINYEFFSSLFRFQHGSAVAFDAWMKYNNGEKPIKSEELYPNYLRQSQAERERNSKKV